LKEEAEMKQRVGVVMILEEQALITLYVEELVRQAEYSDIVSFPSCAEAIGWLSDNTPLLAIVETRVRDGKCGDVVDILVKRGVPYIVHSVERQGLGHEAGMAGTCRWIDKPCDPDDFIEAIKQCVHPKDAALRSTPESFVSKNNRVCASA
jgi:DNA-binding NtrC family response regulator